MQSNATTKYYGRNGTQHAKAHLNFSRQNNLLAD